MGEPKCIYCGTSKDLSNSDIIPDALTASRIINKCVCHVEHNSGMTKKFESEVAEKLAFLLNLSLIHISYHTLGLFKWEKLGIKYPLEGVNPPSEEAVAKAEKILGIEKVSQK